MNVETGQISENVELENLDEDETDDFKKEWRQRSTHASLIRHPHHPYHHQINSNRFYQPSSGSQLAIEHGSSNRQYPRSSKHVNNSSHQPQFHHSDTIDLTDDVEEIGQLPLPVKRKASSNNVNIQRKHRQNRFSNK
jgi:cell envelope opacity-associated protein A